jgi:hypothetical protein
MDRAGSAQNALAILAVGGELLLERRQLREWRIGIDRALAFARRGGGGELAVRRPAVATALVTAAFAPTLVTAAAELAFVAVPALVVVPALVSLPALEALARRTVLVVLARRGHRGALGGRCRDDTFGRRIGAGFAEFIAAVAPSAPMPLALCTFADIACFTGSGGGRRSFLGGTVLMAMTAAIMTRPALFRPAAGPPDFYQFGNSSRLGRCCDGVALGRRCSIACRNSLCLCFSGNLRRRFSGGRILCHFTRCSFTRCSFD